MDQLDDALMTAFTAAAREHLAGIEPALLEREQAGTAIDGELASRAFRAAHAIKGGAGALNLPAVRALARRLESLLHLVRDHALPPDGRTVQAMLAGFGRLSGLVEAAGGNDARDDADVLAELAALEDQHLTGEQKALAAAVVPVALPDGTAVFFEDGLSLHQAAAAGRHLYLVEYDLIHDVQARGRTPLDVIATMEASGLIVDCRTELAAVGDLDAPPVNRIPFYVLFATVVEPDIIGYLFALDPERIHPVSLPDAANAPAAPELPAVADVVDVAAVADVADVVDVAEAGTIGEADARPERRFGSWRLDVGADGAVVSLEEREVPDAAGAREALLAALSQGLGVTLDWGDAPGADLALVQVVAAAARTFAKRGLPFGHADGAPRALADAAARAGIDAEALAAAGLPAETFFSA